jgi:CDP-glycerol glycerophosphotransferase (TagB/SpsB family)
LDLFVTSSNDERDFIRAQMGYATEVVATGLPRFDALHGRTPTVSRRRVLFMPTWRSHLVAPSYQREREVAAVFEKSDYHHFLRTFLQSERLHRVLERHDLDLEFYPHYEIAGLVSNLVPDHPRLLVAPPARKVQDALVDCSLFLTDWSSVFFDAAYLGKPLAMAPFDEEEFRERHYRKGYFDLTLHGFGPTVRRPAELVAAIEMYAARNFVREARYEDRVTAFFSHHDTKNSERVVAALRRVAKG